MTFTKHLANMLWYITMGFYIIVLFPFLIFYLIMTGLFELFHRKPKSD